MRRYGSFNNLFSYDRKLLYVVLTIVVFSIFSLTVIYASLSTMLNIDGNAEVSAASWDIYLDNVVLNSQSVTASVPMIVDSRTVNFSTILSKPGDFYEFTIDVVNDGSIDAMIDEIIKTPTLSTSQAKYLNYIVEYQNGEAISTKQLVSKNSFVRLNVKVEFRKDISASDLPQISETLNLSFKVNYVQSDESGVSVKDNGTIKKVYEVVSGNLDTIGSEICIENECFFVIASDEAKVTMFAKYNLYAGKKCTSSSCVAYGNEATGLQDITMIGMPSDSKFPREGTLAFSSTNYWSSITSYPAYIYDSNSNLYSINENYKSKLEEMGAKIEEIRLIKKEELETLGCSGSSCTSSSYSWSYSTSYWTGSAVTSSNLCYIRANGYFGGNPYTLEHYYGVRPVIVILKSEF